MDFKGNFLPAMTWNFLHMNYAEVKDFSVGSEDGTLTSLYFPETEVPAEPSHLTFSFTEEFLKKKQHQVEITVEAGMQATVVMHLLSAEGEQGDLLLTTLCRLEAGASLTLVQAQVLNEQCRVINDIQTETAEGSSFDLKQIIIGGKESYYQCFTALPAKKADFHADIAYLLSGDEKLDMNYVADHTGPKTACELQVSGVLRERAEKLFRGTIDFHRGCAGAVGTELESVLLMDETVVNRTIPLILCDEEDVEGAHGASIGRVDENVLFYLRSRGLPEDEIYEMMARAKVDIVLSKIEDQDTVKLITAYLDGKERLS